MARKRKGAKDVGARLSRAARSKAKIGTMLPASFRSHMKASIREGLLAFESLFDAAVKALEKEERRKSRRKGRKITLE